MEGYDFICSELNVKALQNISYIIIYEPKFRNCKGMVDAV